MRRIYYRFPPRADLSFAFGMSFAETLRYVSELNGQETTKMTKDATKQELVKVKTKVEISINRAEFREFEPEDFKPGTITEAADLRISVLALALRGGGKVPIANDVFYIRLTDQRTRTDVDIAKEGTGEGLDALDIKNLLLGVSS